MTEATPMMMPSAVSAARSLLAARPFRAVRNVLKQVVNDHVNCLEEPEPLIILTGFADSAVTLQLSFYVERKNFLMVRNEIYEQIKLAFDTAGIEIPFPHRTLYTGDVTKPFPVRVVGGESSEQSRTGD